MTSKNIESRLTRMKTILGWAAATEKCSSRKISKGKNGFIYFFWGFLNLGLNFGFFTGIWAPTDFRQ